MRLINSYRVINKSIMIYLPTLGNAFILPELTLAMDGAKWSIHLCPDIHQPMRNNRFFLFISIIFFDKDNMKSFVSTNDVYFQNKTFES